MSHPSDAGYRSTPSTDRPVRDEIPVESLPDLKRPERASIWWTRGQLAFVGVLLAILVGTWMLMAIFMPNYAGLLWRHPLGIKLTLGIIACTLIGVVFYLGFCLPINGVLPAGDRERQFGRTVSSALIATVLFAVFAMGMFTLVIGPASIQIMENLSGP